MKRIILGVAVPAALLGGALWVRSVLRELDEAFHTTSHGARA